MPISTRVIAATIALTSMLAVMASGTVAMLDRGPDVAQIDARDHSVTKLRAAIPDRLDESADASQSRGTWRCPGGNGCARGGGGVRDMGTSSLLRTHGANGARPRESAGSL